MSDTDCDASVVATVSVKRACGTLLFPVAAITLLAAILYFKGYSLADYPELVRTDELSVFRQSLLWFGLLVFFVGMYPRAIKAILQDRRLAYVQDGQLFLVFAKANIAVADVRGVRIRSDLLGQSLVVLTKDGSELATKAAFIAERAHVVEARLMRNGAQIGAGS